jgi:hypothetical protein
MNNEPMRNNEGISPEGISEPALDGLLAEMSAECLGPKEAAASRDTVWSRITSDPAWAQLEEASLCTAFRADFDACASGRLTEARRLLIDDHLTRCAACRRIREEQAVARTRLVEVPPIRPSARKPRLQSGAVWFRWAAAAAVAVVSLYASRDQIDRALAPSGPRATLEASSGGVFRLPQGAWKHGDALSAGDVIRTGAGAHAILRLTDGSRVELNERTELLIETAWSGETIHLERGDLLVEAAPQGYRRLRVVTQDSEATVKGTVFAVSADAGGSLVSVVEGSVGVVQPGLEQVLTPGQQAASNAAFKETSVRDAIAWSSDSEKYFSVLATVAQVEKDIAALPSAALRTEAQLVRYMPAGTRIYFAFPNLDGAIGQAVRLFEQRARDNATLSEWWNSNQGQEARQSMERLQTVTSYLGNEIAVFGVWQGTESFPVVIAQVKPGQDQALRQAMQSLIPGQADLPFRVTPEWLIVSESTARIDRIVPQLGTGAASPFAQEITARYRNGAGWLTALDITSFDLKTENSSITKVLGIANTRTAFFEQRSVAGTDDLAAAVTFNGSRTGMASWLARPGSAGSMEYVSSEAQAVFSASTRDPRQAFEELLRLSGPELLGHLSEFEKQTGVSITSDLAGSLGSDFTLSLERVSLPVPGIVAVAEVLHPTAFDAAIGRMVEAANRLHSTGDAQLITLTLETVNGRTWHVLHTPASMITLEWTYDRGYLLASSDRALVLRAIQTRDSGLSLPRSSTFRQAVPNGSLHHSGYFWVNANGTLADAASLIQSPAIQSLIGTRTPVLVVFDGETEQIAAASRTRLTSLVLDLMLTSGVARANGAR